MRYGLPYKGSKNKIIPFLMSQFPKKTHFYDMFAGGCSVTHGAMLSGKFKTFTVNDISDYPSVFLEAIGGKYANEKRWISREDFYRLKDSEPYIRYCWSFGNNGFDYLYSKVVEPWKKALHYARLFNDFSLLHEIGLDTDDASGIWIKAHSKECKEKYIKWYCKTVLKNDYDTEKLRLCLTEKIKENSENLRNYLLEGLKKANKRPCDVDRFLGMNGMAGHYFGRSQWGFPTREVYEKLQGFLYLPQSYNDIYGLQELCESLQRLERLQSLEVLQGDYKSVPVLPDSLVYCDIPYKDTDGYKGGFNHAEFYDWARKQKELVIISEYSMPEDFICIAQIEKSVNLCSGNNKKAVEKLFIPKTQLDLWLPLKIEVKKYKQLEFNFD